MDWFNNIKPPIYFIFELETNNMFGFLHLFLMNNNNNLEFKTHHKSSNQNYHIHYYSHHYTKMKKWIILGVYLKAFKICTLTFFNDEFDNMENSFTQLLYPKSFIQHAKRKALKIPCHKYS